MPDVTVMVPELEIRKSISKIHVSRKKCGGTLVLHIHYDGYKTDTAMYEVVGPRTIPNDV
jgi:hypothetical protein